MSFESPVHCSGGILQGVFDDMPDTCGWCGVKGMQRLIGQGHCGDHVDAVEDVVFLAQCPDNACNGIYLVYYKSEGVPAIDAFNHKNGLGAKRKFRLAATSPRLQRKDEYPKVVREMSPQFCKIHTQASMAESHGLDEIAGPGYRKAFEHLTKDFLLKHEGKKEEDLKGKTLGAVIKAFLKDEKLKKMAERIAWLGNDETHWYRQWEDKGIEDLKDLIRISVAYIESEYLFDKYRDEMPAGKK